MGFELVAAAAFILAEATATHIWVAVIALAASIGSAVIAGPLMWILNRLSKSNAEDHRTNVEKLTNISERLAVLDEKFDHHLTWHAEHPLAPQIINLHPHQIPESDAA